MKLCFIIFVNLFREDTDIALLLLYYWQTEYKELYINTEKSGKIWNISHSAKALGNQRRYC